MSIYVDHEGTWQSLVSGILLLYAMKTDTVRLACQVMLIGENTFTFGFILWYVTYLNRDNWQG